MSLSPVQPFPGYRPPRARDDDYLDLAPYRTGTAPTLTEQAALDLSERMFRRTVVAAVGGAVVGAMLMFGALVLAPGLYARMHALLEAPVPTVIVEPIVPDIHVPEPPPVPAVFPEFPPAPPPIPPLPTP